MTHFFLIFLSSHDNYYRLKIIMGQSFFMFFSWIQLTEPIFYFQIENTVLTFLEHVHYSKHSYY